MMTPETRCKIEAIADGGNFIVDSSKLTGLCFFTIVAFLKAQNEESVKYIQRSTQLQFPTPSDF
ncbi:hypothetical protein [Aliidiomarina maris]|uniref:hypothetical protein n=1 Tax=Aliidiomarina maris TaxID=531312 RepID=UPI001F541991|nr:hypothetical protein [Aliidiomarina maris]